MPRKQHQYHYIYKTTCLISGKYYIGMHSTSNLEDGYIGSGQRLWKSIKKHGKENHVKEILEYLPDRSSLKIRERELVNERLIDEPMCMNLQLGGGGGFTKEHSIKGTYSMLNKIWSDSEFINRKKIKMSETNKKLHSLGILKSFTKKDGSHNWKGRKHSDETKKKLSSSNSQKGYNNSQYGTCWITNEKENKKIHKGDLIPEGWRLGRITSRIREVVISSGS